MVASLSVFGIISTTHNNGGHGVIAFDNSFYVFHFPPSLSLSYIYFMITLRCLCWSFIACQLIQSIKVHIQLRALQPYDHFLWEAITASMLASLFGPCCA